MKQKTLQEIQFNLREDDSIDWESKKEVNVEKEARK